MGWYLDLWSFLLERDVGVIGAVGMTLLGIIGNMGVVMFARYVDNWEYGMDRKDMPEAMLWGLLCFIPYLLFTIAVVGGLGAVVTMPIWYPFKLRRDQQKREGRSIEFRREQELEADEAHIAAEAEVEQVEQRVVAPPTQPINS